PITALIQHTFCETASRAPAVLRIIYRSTFPSAPLLQATAMLSTMRSSWLLFALAALIALSSALNLEDFHIDGINQYLHHGKRQEPSGTGTPDEPSETEGPSSTDEP